MSNVRYRLRAATTGSGPGIQTADGCSVELYRLIPYRGELDAVQFMFSPDITVLELGCGAGRLTRHLLHLGCRVTAVDNSAEMLDQAPRRAELVHADIETLDLGVRFDIVLLASNLVNHPDPSTRAALIAAARRHARSGAHLLVERQDPEWLLEAKVGPLGTSDGVSMAVEAVSREGRQVHMTLRYEARGQCWLQSFTALALGEQAIEALLGSYGFAAISWFGPGRRWVRAVARERAEPNPSIEATD